METRDILFPLFGDFVNEFYPNILFGQEGRARCEMREDLSVVVRLPFTEADIAGNDPSAYRRRATLIHETSHAWAFLHYGRAMLRVPENAMESAAWSSVYLAMQVMPSPHWRLPAVHPSIWEDARCAARETHILGRTTPGRMRKAVTNLLDGFCTRA